MIKKKKCDICNNKFYINKAITYLVQTHLDSIVSLRPEIYNAVDCPNCGCQILLCKRLEKVQLKEGGLEDAKRRTNRK